MSTQNNTDVSDDCSLTHTEENNCLHHTVSPQNNEKKHQSSRKSPSKENILLQKYFDDQKQKYSRKRKDTLFQCDLLTDSPAKAKKRKLTVKESNNCGKSNNKSESQNASEKKTSEAKAYQKQGTAAYRAKQEEKIQGNKNTETCKTYERERKSLYREKQKQTNDGDLKTSEAKKAYEKQRTAAYRAKQKKPKQTNDGDLKTSEAKKAYEKQRTAAYRAKQKKRKQTNEVDLKTSEAKKAYEKQRKAAYRAKEKEKIQSNKKTETCKTYERERKSLYREKEKQTNDRDLKTSEVKKAYEKQRKAIYRGKQKKKIQSNKKTETSKTNERERKSLYREKQKQTNDGDFKTSEAKKAYEKQRKAIYRGKQKESNKKTETSKTYERERKSLYREKQKQTNDGDLKTSEAKKADEKQRKAIYRGKQKEKIQSNKKTETSKTNERKRKSLYREKQKQTNDGDLKTSEAKKADEKQRKAIYRGKQKEKIQSNKKTETSKTNERKRKSLYREKQKQTNDGDLKTSEAKKADEKQRKAIYRGKQKEKIQSNKKTETSKTNERKRKSLYREKQKQTNDGDLKTSEAKKAYEKQRTAAYRAKQKKPKQTNDGDLKTSEAKKAYEKQRTAAYRAKQKKRKQTNEVDLKTSEAKKAYEKQRKAAYRAKEKEKIQSNKKTETCKTYERERKSLYREKEKQTNDRDLKTSEVKKAYEKQRKAIYRGKQKKKIQSNKKTETSKTNERERKSLYREKQKQTNDGDFKTSEAKKAYEKQRKAIYRGKQKESNKKTETSKTYERERKSLYREKQKQTNDGDLKTSEAKKADEKQRKAIYRGKQKEKIQSNKKTETSKTNERKRKSLYREKQKQTNDGDLKTSEAKKADEKQRKAIYRGKQKEKIQSNKKTETSKTNERKRKSLYREKQKQTNDGDLKTSEAKKADEKQRKAIYRGKQKEKIQSNKKTETSKTNERKRKSLYREKQKQTNDGDLKTSEAKKADEKQRKAIYRGKQKEMNNYEADRTYERARKSIYRKKQKQNKSTQILEKERSLERKRKTVFRKSVKGKNTAQHLIENFHMKVKEGPTFICCSCQLLYYKGSVKKFVPSVYSKCTDSLLQNCTRNIPSSSGFMYICNSCHACLLRNEIPALSVGNNLNLVPIPETLKNLSSLEVTLISKRVPFMKILGLPRGKQKAVHGCVVNVPLNPDETCGVLPRMPSSSAITVKLKRKLHYRGHVLKQTIRPWKILCALHYLKRNNKHYSDIAINNEWQEDCEHENSELWENLTHDNNSKEPIQLREDIESDLERIEANEDQVNTSTNNEETNAEVNIDEHDDNQDIRDKLSGIPFDTCLQPKDISSDSDFLLSIAPGEGKKPLSFQTDTYSEEMSFPNLFPNGSFGFHHSRPRRLSMKQYFKSRVLHYDNRFSSSIEYIFFAQYRCEAKEIADCLSVAMRKCKGEVTRNRITAGVIKESQTIRQLTRNDLSYHFLQKVRGSPAYYNKMMYDLLGMIRHLGACTWFLTLSAADMKWYDTIQIIGAQHGEVFTNDDVENMSWEQKSFWLRSNPVTAARHFDHRLQLFMSEVLCAKPHPIGQILDYKYRIEFQQRGSPHAHMVIWVKDAPSISEETKENVQQFVDQYVTCAMPTDDEILKETVNTVQIHTHSVACRKPGKSCRFGFPLPSMTETKVFLPLDNQPTENTTKFYKNLLHEVQTQLYDLPLDSTQQLDDILSAVNVRLQDYINAIHWLKTKNGQPAVILRRLPSESRINFYNKTLLSAWTANMDIQYVTNVYACVMYVASYMSKPEKTLGDLLKSVSNTCEPLGPKSKMQNVAKKFLTHREVSAQEAVYRLLSLPLSQSSRQVQFVPTNPPEERTCLLKPLRVIQQMEDDDDDILQKGTIYKYTKRPPSLDKCCMADFVSHYRSDYKKRVDDTDETELNIDININEDQQLPRHDLPKVIRLLDNEGTLSLRKRPIILRTHQFSRNKDEEKYYHSKLMLYYPWRNEEIDLKAYDATYKTKFFEIFHEIESNILFHEPKSTDVEDAAKLLQENGPPENAWATLAAEFEQEEEQDRAQGLTLDPQHAHLSTEKDAFNPQDIGLLRYEYEVNVGKVSRPEWLQMTCSLNETKSQFMNSLSSGVQRCQ